MEFLTDAQRRVRAEARQFAAAEIRPLADAIEAANAVDNGLVRKMGDCGWFGITIPKEYGGMEAGHLAKTLCIEEARASGSEAA